MPVNALIMRALARYYLYYGDNFKVVCPTGSGKMKSIPARIDLSNPLLRYGNSLQKRLKYHFQDLIERHHRQN